MGMVEALEVSTMLGVIDNNFINLLYRRAKKMSSVNEKIQQNIERYRQQEHQRQAQKAREKKKLEAINRDRERVIGKIVSDYFPEVMRFQPCRTDEDNKIEFALFIGFLSELSSDMEYISNIKGKVKSGLNKIHKQ